MTRILIAVDNPPVRRTLERLLSEAGYEVLTASDGHEAAKRALVGDLALAVLDARMNGTVACRLLKSQPTSRGLPVILVGARTDPGSRSSRLETGADHYMPENAPPEDTLDVIKDLLSRTSAGANVVVGAPGTGADLLGGMSQLLDRKLFEAAILSELGQAAASVEGADKAFTSVMEVVARAVDFSAGALAFAEGSQVDILLMINWPLPPAALDDLEARIVSGVRGERGPAPSMQVSTRRFVGRTKDQAPRPEERSISNVEILSSRLAGGSTGLMAVAGPSMSRLVKEHPAFLDRLASQALLVTQNARLADRVHELSLRDDLTGLHNHRHTLKLVQAELERSERYGSPFSLLLIDIDHFKTVNDDHGHPAGDAALRSVAGLLSEALRAVDHVGRYGGEEFAVILPHTGREAARNTAERLRAMVETHDLGSAPAGFRVTVSIGVATTAGGEATAASDLLKEAGLALSRAKDAGRNSVG